MGIAVTFKRFHPILMLSSRRCISYQYSPLLSTVSFRLLKFNASVGDGISFSISVFNLRRAPKFDALSYTWGRPLPPFSVVDSLTDNSSPGNKKPAENRTESAESSATSSHYDRHFPVFCDEQEILVTANLFDALHMLRKTTFPSANVSQSHYFWIDALCINQNDTADRTRQVAIMSKIYKAAEKVIAWLGPEDRHTADALAVINSVSMVQKQQFDLVKYSDFTQDDAVYLKLGITPLRLTHFLGLIAFFSRPWFKRAWVVQEVALARKIVVVCGESILPWELISHTLSFLKATGWQSKLTAANLKRLSATEAVGTGYKKLLASSSQLETAAIYLDRTRQDLERKRAVRQRGPVRSRLPSLRLLLETHRHTLTTDPRDKIYGFLGLAGKQLKPWSTHPKCIEPDYDVSTSTLYIQTARTLMLSYSSLGLLSHVQDALRTRLTDLPSWCPDWSVELRHSPLRFRGDCNWCANSTLRWTSVESEGKLLAVQGKRIDTIEEVSFIPDEAQTQRAYWSNVANLAAPLDELYSAKPASGKCFSDLKFVVTGVMLKTGRNDMESLIREFGGTLFKEVRSTVDWVVVGTKAGPSKLADAQRLGIPCVGEDGLKTLLAQRLARNLSMVSSRSPISRWEALWRTMIADTFKKEHPAPSSCEGIFRKLLNDEFGTETVNKAWDALLPTAETADTSPSTELNQLRSELEATSTQRRLFCTANRRLLGLAPLSSQPGDEIWVLGGGQVPYILRRQSNGRYVLVGESYVHRIMHGEAMKMVPGIERIILQ